MLPTLPHPRLGPRAWPTCCGRGLSFRPPLTSAEPWVPLLGLEAGRGVLFVRSLRNLAFIVEGLLGSSRGGIATPQRTEFSSKWKHPILVCRSWFVHHCFWFILICLHLWPECLSPGGLFGFRRGWSTGWEQSRSPQALWGALSLAFVWVSSIHPFTHPPATTAPSLPHFQSRC